MVTARIDSWTWSDDAAVRSRVGGCEALRLRTLMSSMMCPAAALDECPGPGSSIGVP